MYCLPLVEVVWEAVKASGPVSLRVCDVSTAVFDDQVSEVMVDDGLEAEKKERIY